MALSNKGSQAPTPPERACTYCRDRKIRCGREKPECSNCKRDKVDCHYVTHGKRVNHVKLLCNNVGSMDDRLRGIETGLSRLEDMLLEQADSRRANGGGVDLSPGNMTNTSKTDDDEVPYVGTNGLVCKSAERLCRLTIDQHISIDGYYGPSTLYSLCSAFVNDARLENRIREVRSDGGSKQQAAKFQQMQTLLAALRRAGKEVPLVFPVPIGFLDVRLPPKQFLLLIANQYFNQKDYRTDVFMQSSFLSNISRLYRSYTTSDYSWAVCFHTIVMLTLGDTHTGSQGSDSSVESQFALPFRQTVETAFSNIYALMQPKLINVQTLAILSVAAQEFYCSRLSESLLMSACVVAKQLGLDQMGYHKPPDLSFDDHEERVKVFASLYIRDKSLLTCRGSICWLPTSNSGMSFTDSAFSKLSNTYAASLELASIQEDIYQSFKSAKTRDTTESERYISYTRICQALDQWHSKYLLPSPISASMADIPNKASLHLEFLSTRLSIFTLSSEAPVNEKAVVDARASCALILLASGKTEPNLRQKIAQTMLIGDVAGECETGAVELMQTTERRSLACSLSATAIFVLVNNILFQELGNVIDRDDDISLLQGLTTIYKDLHARTYDDNHQHIGHVLDILLKILGNMTNGQQMSDHQHGSTIENNWTNQDILDVSSDGSLDDFLFSQMGTSVTTPSLSSWTPRISAESQINFGQMLGESHEVMLPMEMDFFVGTLESSQQQQHALFDNLTTNGTT